MYVTPEDGQYGRNVKLVLTELMKFVVIEGDVYINFKYNTPQHDEPYQKKKKSFNVVDDIKIILLCILTSTSYTIIIINIIHN